MSPSSLSLLDSNNLFVLSVVNITLPHALANWGPKNFDAYETTTLKFFTERKGYEQDDLAKLAAIPVTLVYCLADVAYPPDYMDVFASQLSEAGVNVHIHSVPNAPHFGCATHPQL